MSLSTLTAAILEFRDQRNWAQFHSLRNLIVSLNLEASELLELTQWKSDAEMAAIADSASAQEALRDECADVLIYLLLIAENAGIDLEEAVSAKLVKMQSSIRLRAAMDRTGSIQSKQGLRMLRKSSDSPTAMTFPALPIMQVMTVSPSSVRGRGDS